MHIACNVMMAILGGTLTWGLFVPPEARSQSIIPNGLGSQVSDGFCRTSCTITGGSRATPTGPNLFHSFSQFSIPEGSTATLGHDADIDRIFLRVTDAPSFLDGQLATDIGGATGHADLFFLNPQGIVFGPHASLNLGGSFIGTTAEQVQFDSEAEVFRVNEAAPTLSVNVPVGLQLGASSGSINVGTEEAPGPGNGLFINGQNLSINRSNRPDGLAVREGKTLALVGDGVEFVGSNLTASQGRIELGSLKGNESISLMPNLMGWQLNYAPETQFSDINLSQASSLDVSGTSGGQIQIKGNSLNLSEGAVILAETLGDGTGGLIYIDADAINLAGISSLPLPGSPPVSTGLFADLGVDQAGIGGTLNLNAKALNITEGARVSASTFGQGAGGDLFIGVDTIKIQGRSMFGPSLVLAFVAPEATGNAGKIMIDTNMLLLQNSGNISASTFGDGDAGAIIINASDLDVIGTLSGGGDSAIASTANAFGKGGNIQINTDRLRLNGGGYVATTTFSDAAAGQLEVNATESVEISGRSNFIPPNSSEAPRTGLFSSAIFEAGRAGNISINTPTLTVKEGGIISVSNFPSFAGFPPGTGPSGNISITAGQVILDGDAGLGAKTNHNADGPGGANIEISANRILLDNKSFINASAEGTADGGNITLTTPFLVAAPQSDSNITANAKGGDGGNIAITAKGILGFAIQPAIPSNGTNDIDASSEAGADGVISTQGLDADSKVDLVNIPDAPRDASQLIGNACNGPSKIGGQFLITGRGGLPPKPKAMRAGLTPLIEFDDDLLAQLATDTTAAGDRNQPSQSPHPRRLSRRPSPENSSLTEAQHWKRGPNNQITLMASHKATPSQSLSTTCL